MLVFTGQFWTVVEPSYDDNGNRVTHTDANGQVRTFEYDGLDRRIEASYPAATGSESIQVEYEYDGNGNRTEVLETIAAGGTEISNYHYDAFDRLEVETDRFGQQITHVYDAKGNRIRRIDAAGTTIYGIDALDRVQSVTAPGRGAVTYTYSPAGRVEQIDHPDGTRTEQTYDEAGRLETIAHFRDGLREAFYAYDYDLNGNRSSQTEDLGSGEVLTTYDYDRADRLVETERAGRVTTYVLDAVGNRREEIVTEGAVTTEKTFDYNARDQLQRIWLDGSLEAEYAYDANGNRIRATTGGVTREFNFGARDRLRSLNVQGSPPEVEWLYDDAGFRIAETTPAEARRFRWDGESMAFETNVLGNLLMRYDHGPDRLLAETEAGNTRTWLTDALKTPVKRLTETGTTYSVTRYDEYGEVEEETSPDIPRFGFTGHQRGPQEAPDLYYAQQRWYNAATGRFISEGPVLGEPKRPLSLHRYLYAYANPTIYVDPDGRCPVALSAIQCHQISAENIGVDPYTREGAQAVNDFDRGQMVGIASALVDTAKETALLVGDAVGHPIEAASGGRVDIGSGERNRQRLTGIKQFVSAPAQTIGNAITTHGESVSSALEEGRYFDAGRQSGEFGTNANLTLMGLAGGVRGVASLPRHAPDSPNTTVPTPSESGTGTRFVPMSPGSPRTQIGAVNPNSTATRGVPPEIRALSEANIAASGRTVLGHYPGYIEKAQRTGAIYFDIGDAWNTLTPDQRTAANMHFLDIAAEAGDQIYLSLPKTKIRPHSALADEVQYLTGEKGYRWINQWSLRPGQD